MGCWTSRYSHIISFRNISKHLVYRNKNFIKTNSVLQVAAQGPDPKEIEEKVDRMTSTLDSLQTRYARLLAEHDATHSKLKHRVTQLEKKLVPPQADPSGEAPPPTPEIEATK